MKDMTISANINAKDPTSQAWADLAGIVASIGCAIHCAAMPLVLAYLPTLGLSWLADEGFHQTMAVVCFLLAAASFLPGFQRHKSVLPAILGGCGLLLLTVAAFGLEGSCCPTCSDQQAILAESQPCGEAACQLCETVAKEIAPEPTEEGLDAPYLALLTPLGGVMLVVGHIANHRKNCLCGSDKCCLEVDVTEPQES